MTRNAVQILCDLWQIPFQVNISPVLFPPLLWGVHGHVHTWRIAHTHWPPYIHMALTPHDTATVLALAAHILKLEQHCCHQCNSEGKTLTGQHGPPSPPCASGQISRNPAPSSSTYHFGRNSTRHFVWSLSCTHRGKLNCSYRLTSSILKTLSLIEEWKGQLYMYYYVNWTLMCLISCPLYSETEWSGEEKLRHGSSSPMQCSSHWVYMAT